MEIKNIPKLQEIEAIKKSLSDTLPDTMNFLFSLSDKHKSKLKWHGHGFSLYLKKSISKEFLEFKKKAIDFKEYSADEIECDVMVIGGFLIVKRNGLTKLNPIKNKTRIRCNLGTRLRHEVFKRDRYRCIECGVTNKEGRLHCDHIIAVAQGGTDEMDNLQTLCEDCNLAKSDRCWIGGNK